MIILKHKDTGLSKECTTGFSWTVFFFGVFVPLIRGDLKWAAIFFVLTLLVGLPTLGLGCFLVGPIFAFFYNKVFIRGLMENGFIPADDHSYNWYAANGLLAAPLINAQPPQASQSIASTLPEQNQPAPAIAEVAPATEEETLSQSGQTEQDKPSN